MGRKKEKKKKKQKKTKKKEKKHLAKAQARISAQINGGASKQIDSLRASILTWKESSNCQVGHLTFLVEQNEPASICHYELAEKTGKKHKEREILFHREGWSLL